MTVPTYAPRAPGPGRRRHPAGLRLHLRRRQHAARRPHHQRAARPAERVHARRRSSGSSPTTAWTGRSPVQLWASLSRFVTGDLGVSMRSNLPVSTLIAEVLPSTLMLARPRFRLALVLAFAIAYGTRNAARTRSARAAARLPLAVPVGAQLRDRPGADPHLRLPARPLPRDRRRTASAATFFAAVALGIPVSARIAEVLIANLDHECAQEYAGFATSRGLGRARAVLPGTCSSRRRCRSSPSSRSPSASCSAVR